MKLLLMLLACLGYASIGTAQTPANLRIRIVPIVNDSINTRLVLNWDAVSGVSSYDVRVYSNPRIVELEASRIITGALTFTIVVPRNKLLPGTVIYLTVMGVSSPKRGSITIPAVASVGLATLPPYNLYALDTINIFKNPITNALWPTVLSVDSTQPDRLIIERMDANNQYYSFKISIQPDAELTAGAVVTSPLNCPLKLMNTPISYIRWSPPHPSSNVNAATTLSIAKAAATQLPISILTDMTRLSIQRYLQRDSTWLSGKSLYTECFGNLI